MKVLFAVSNDEISESIIKRYQKDYKEIISHKNVYYFNAILKELQKDKSYDRIVISEDLEAFSHTQYDQIDKFIFDKLDSISDEASNIKGNDIPIILICADRRTKSEEMLVKLFGIGIYNAILGNDRSVEEVCKLLKRPRLKKEAKLYYKIDSEEVKYKPEDENDVPEMEIQNILAYYKSLGRDENRYVEGFDNIAAQYNDAQLRIISKFLPLNVRAVLEEKSPKYQQIMSFNNKVSNGLRIDKNKEKEEGTSEKLLKPKNKPISMSKPVVIPSSVNMQGVKKLSRTKQQDVSVEQNIAREQTVPKQVNTQVEQPIMPKVEEKVQEEVVKPVKRGRGRPRKNAVPQEPVVEKNVAENVEAPVKKKRGRPRKNPLPEEQETTILPGFEEKEEETTILPGFEEIEQKPEPKQYNEQNRQDGVFLPGFDDEEEETTILPGFDEQEDDEEDLSKQDSTILPGLDNYNTYEPQEQNYNYSNNYDTQNNNMFSNYNSQSYNNSLAKHDEYVQSIDISSLLTSDKKIVTFVGTSKNGTSFIVNNVAELLSTMGINVAILDTTQNRNSYYIYTKNEEQLRNVASHSVEDLARGVANGIQVHQNLTVYTSLPDENEAISNVDEILQTLVQNYSLILIDCDFSTPIGYFKQSQETYLVQSADILTIQPLTAFLRELKARNVLDEKKLKIILNKYVKIRGVNEKTIIGGMAFYNDPAMSFMTELFDRTLIKYMTIPFEEEIYVKYLEGVINCDITLKGYSKQFMQILKELGNMIYPLVSGRGTYVPPTSKSKNNSQMNSQMGTFSPSMNDTLNQMKRNF